MHKTGVFCHFSSNIKSLKLIKIPNMEETSVYAFLLICLKKLLCPCFIKYQNTFGKKTYLPV